MEAPKHPNQLSVTFLSLLSPLSHYPPPSLIWPWPVCLVLGNTTPLRPQSPTNLHTLQQHITGKRETHSPPVCLCVGGYMIAFNYVCQCAVFTGMCVCACKHMWMCMCVEADAIRSDMCGVIGS